jgi:hypothetical protein
MSEWKVEEADFNNPAWGDGRTVVYLANGVGLSIITAARNAYIREQKRWSPSALLHGWEVTDVMATAGTFEVGAIRADGEFDRRGLNPSPGWQEDHHDGVVYINVPAEQINAYVASIGVRDG